MSCIICLKTNADEFIGTPNEMFCKSCFRGEPEPICEDEIVQLKREIEVAKSRVRQSIVNNPPAPQEGSSSFTVDLPYDDLTYIRSLNERLQKLKSKN